MSREILVSELEGDLFIRGNPERYVGATFTPPDGSGEPDQERGRFSRLFSGLQNLLAGDYEVRRTPLGPDERKILEERLGRELEPDELAKLEKLETLH